MNPLTIIIIVAIALVLWLIFAYNGLVRLKNRAEEAWTIMRGTTASKAAGVIHTDFEKNFVKAEVVSYEKLISAGDWNKVKEKGEVMLKGKDYEVQDGDVIYFRAGK